jgi:tetratricopeptide (TPR) repeat protein
LDARLRAQTNPQRVPAHYRVLVGLVAEGPQGARKALADMPQNEILNRLVAQELSGALAKDPNLMEEVLRLIRTSVAHDIGMDELGRRWALEVLEKRPTSAWAAALASLGLRDVDARRAVLAKFEPKDSPVADLLRVIILTLEGRHEEAAKAYARVASVDEDNPYARLEGAARLEAAGKTDEALAIYEDVWARAKLPEAANNAAYLLVETAKAGDTARFTHARQLIDQALADRPDHPALLDTKGWVLYRAGRTDEALPYLRRAVRRARSSAEVHYHAGMVELAVGSPDLGRWHLQATVDLVEATGDDATQPARRAAEKARAKLAELDAAAAASG